MVLTAEEKLMYRVMQVIYESGIPIDFKGSMVLRACLLEAGYSEEILFRMDMDVNRPVAETKFYEIAEIRFRRVSVDQMLADKISVVSGDKVFRRIKDVVDLYYLSRVFPFHGTQVKQALESSGRDER